MYETFEGDVFTNLKKTKIRVATKAEGAKWEIPTITPAKLKSQMYNVISKYNSIYKDNSWENVHKLDKDLARILPNLSVIEAKYSHDEFGVPNRKRWTWCGAIEDNKKKQFAVIIDITAHGAGSVKDPLDRYDITGVVNVLRPSKVTDPDVLDYMAQYKVEEKTASKVASNSKETDKVINYLSKSNVLNYLDKSVDSVTVEEFRSFFEPKIEDHWKNPMFNWARVNWEVVKDYFKGK